MSKLPTSEVLWRQTIERLAHTPWQFYRHRLAVTTNDFAATFQELIADSIRSESFVEITGDTKGIAEYELAVRLPPDRAEFWRTNLLTILECWSGGSAESLSDGAVGWQVKKRHDPNLIRLVRSGDWTLFGCGQDKLPLQDEFRQRISRYGRPNETGGDSWLEVFLDGPNLPNLSLKPVAVSTNHLPTFTSQPDLPVIKLSIKGRNNNLSIKGDLAFHDSFSWKVEPWRIPTNLIRDPIISFTAVQGFAPILKDYQETLGLRLDPVPNQFFVWAGAGFPVQTLGAVPMEDAMEYLRKLAPQIAARFNPMLEILNAGELVMTTNSSHAAKLRWMGIPPFVTPFIAVEEGSGKDFLLVGTYPNWGTDPPPVVFEYLTSRTNLVYYDWEMTSQHVWSWRNVVNILRHVLEKPRLAHDTASVLWLNSVSNLLGNTITEVTRSDSNRLSLIRQGSIGLTGIELVALAHWLESTNFPMNGVSLAARTNGVTVEK